jgi:predicted branched-subunit amino acid permease
MYLGWNLGTAVGSLAGEALPDPRRLGIDIVPALAFLAVLVPLLRTRAAVGVAIASGIAALILARAAPAGIAVLGAGLAGGAAGAWWTRQRVAATEEAPA